MPPLPGVRRVEHVMGMPVIADLRDDDVDPAVLDDVFAWLRWVDETFSTYKPESEISRLARGELALADAHPLVLEVLARCDELYEETDGWFDAGAAGPGALDPSGLVKGWSVDRAVDLLDEAGARNFALNAGGDMRLRGRAVPAWSWRIGIQHPLERDAVARVLETRELAVATSGAYERGGHVLDPRTGGEPSSGILSVTISGPDLATADAYATAVLAMGPARATHWTARLDGYQALTILADGRVLATPGFPAAS
ncbi:MAG: FAD:protein FMN transferase [Gaiellaceae bacterium]